MTNPSVSTHALPLTARESLAGQMPGLLPMLAAAGSDLRDRGWEASRTVTRYVLKR